MEQTDILKTEAEMLEAWRNGESCKKGSQGHEVMKRLYGQARKLCMQMNCTAQDEEALKNLFGELIGRPLPADTAILTPFYTECGKNIFLEEGVTIRMGGTFQDQGGIYLGKNCIIDHNVMLCTVNYNKDPRKRDEITFAPIHIEERAWIGSNVTILPGVTVGAGAIVAAGSVVTADVTPNSLYAGNPAKFIEPVLPGEFKSWGQSPFEVFVPR